jgi:hypothetical protein
MKTIFLASIAALVVTSAAAQPAPASAPPAPAATAFDSGKLTFEQVIGIADALRQLGNYRDNRTGQTVTVPFKFDGSTLLTLAVDIDAGDKATKTYQDAYFKFEAQELGDPKKLNHDLSKLPDETADAYEARLVAKRKTEIANSDAAKRMPGHPAGALLARLKEGELCLKYPPVAPCTVKNDIPPALLATILPIIER